MVSLAEAEALSPFVTVQAPELLDSPLSLYAGLQQARQAKPAKADVDDVVVLLQQPHAPAPSATGIIGLSSGWFSEELSAPVVQPPQQQQQQQQQLQPRRSKLTRLLSALSSKRRSLRGQLSSRAAARSKAAQLPDQHNLQQLPQRVRSPLPEVDEDDDGNELGPRSRHCSPLASPTPSWLHAGDQRASIDAGKQQQQQRQQDPYLPGSDSGICAAASFTSTTWGMTPSPGCSTTVSPAASSTNCRSRSATPPMAIPDAAAPGPCYNRSSSSSGGGAYAAAPGWYSPLGLSPLAVPGAGAVRCSLAQLSGQLSPCSSLRTALVRLEAAGSRAGRLVDSLGAGLVRLTSFSLAAGVLKQPAGREVLRDWELGPQLGHGASAVTRLVTNRATALPAACKTINKAGIFGCAKARAALMDVQREVAIMQHVRGDPNVVQLQAVYEDARAVHLVMEWCSGGSLVQLLESCPGGRLCEPAAAAVMQAVLGVLARCHGRGLMHRDIKPDNLLLVRPLDDPAALTAESVKVTDFGISVLAAPGEVLSELAGTPDYMAPEVLRRAYGRQADVWSAGVLLHELLSGTVPFQAPTCEKLLAVIDSTELSFDGPRWAGVSPEAKQLTGLMLLRDPELRPTAQQLLYTFAGWLDQGAAASP